MLHLAQHGGSALVVFFMPMAKPTDAAGVSAASLAALGRAPTIITGNAHSEETLSEILRFATQQTGIATWTIAALVGFSAGCQRVRAMRLGGAVARAFVLIDGLHASLPPEAWQVAYAQKLVEEARTGAIVVALSHTYIVTEPKFTSTAAMARRTTGWPLPMPPIGQTVDRTEGGLTVYSTGSKPFDKDAHIAQANKILPRALAAHVRPLLDQGTSPPAPQVPTKPGASSPAAASFDTLGARALTVALAELASGVRESPAHSNRSPRIDAYMGPAGVGEPWCAGAFCWTARAALRPGEQLPHASSLSVAGLITSAGSAFHRKGDGYTPRIGDGAIFARGGEPEQGGKGHIARVLRVLDGAGQYVTIGGNEGDGWRVTSRTLADPDFRGWLAYPQTSAPGAASSEQITGWVFTAAEGWMDIDLEYVPRVVTAEIGAAAPEALKAQAVASRTYAFTAMRDDRTLGTPAKPIGSSQLFQVIAPKASSAAVQSSRATDDTIALYQGRPIVANYVAGGVWWGGGRALPAVTEKWVTYNSGKSGAAVNPSPIADVKRLDNRGCMSSNGAAWLAKNLGAQWFEILRYFYGEDLTFNRLGVPASPALGTPPRPGVDPKSGPTPTPAPKPSRIASHEDGGDDLALLGVAGAALRLILK